MTQRARRASLASFLIVSLMLAAVARRGAADAPTGRYVITNAGMPTGTVYDTQTMLTWQQMAPIMPYAWANAGQYCSTYQGSLPDAGLPDAGWRLPSLTELQTIVDDSQTNPAIDQTAFPCASSDLSWTSSPYVPNTVSAWMVSFADGSSTQHPKTQQFSVRCVQ